MNLRYFILTLILPVVSLQARSSAWGWEVHRYINSHAVEHLPAGMNFWIEHQTFLREHAVDPDMDSNPGYYHYIDIDYYQEFFDGTLPHAWEDMVNLYGENVVVGNGTVPWVIASWTDSLRNILEAGEWEQVWQVAAELGHYVADAHQPLHLTLNYNGQYTGNDGIHSRYESSLVTAHLGEIILPVGEGSQYGDPLDSVFAWIDDMYPFIDDILAADNLASSQDPSHGYTYYTIMWDHLDSLTEVVLDRAIMDLASLWITAWMDAGQPTPPTVSITPEWTPLEFAMQPAYPNPFNPVVTIPYTLERPGTICIDIINLAGVRIQSIQKPVAAGVHRFTWNGATHSSGTYFVRIQTEQATQTQKIILLK